MEVKFKHSLKILKVAISTTLIREYNKKYPTFPLKSIIF